MAYRVRQLAEGSRYPLDSLCERFSGGRTDDVGQLFPRELWQLIEMLKASAARERTGTARSSPAAPQGPRLASKSGDRHTPVEDDEVPF